jgi:katanin p60 ATPase-containing subunit A1
MFRINLKGVQVDDNVDWNEIVKMTEGYSGSDIANVCREAALMQIRSLLNGNFDVMTAINNPNFKNQLEASISKEDLILAIKNISRSVSAQDLEKYVVWANEFKSG